MATIKNMAGEVLRFVDAQGAVSVTLQPDATTVVLQDVETIAQFQGVPLRTIKPTAFVGLPAAVAGTAIVVRPGIARKLWERGKGRTDVYEPEDPVEVDGAVCYRGARRYID